MTDNAVQATALSSIQEIFRNAALLKVVSMNQVQHFSTAYFKDFLFSKICSKTIILLNQNNLWHHSTNSPS